jgi:hypothetical protein
MSDRTKRLSERAEQLSKSLPQIESKLFETPIWQLCDNISADRYQDNTSFEVDNLGTEKRPYVIKLLFQQSQLPPSFVKIDSFLKQNFDKNVDSAKNYSNPAVNFFLSNDISSFSSRGLNHKRKLNSKKKRKEKRKKKQQGPETGLYELQKLPKN